MDVFFGIPIDIGLELGKCQEKKIARNVEEEKKKVRKGKQCFFLV